MIEINLPQLFTAILFITVAIVAIEGFVGRMRERRTVSSLRRNLLRCRICGMSYQKGGGEEEIQQCPECGSPNICGRDRRLG